MDYNSMSRTELESALNCLRLNLEDLKEMMEFDYTFTTAHIGGHKVKKDEEKLAKLKEEILLVHQRLSLGMAPDQL